MLDIKYIIDNQNQVKESLAKKGFPSENVDNLISTYLEMNKLKTSSQALAEEKNRLSNSIKSASAEERPAIIAKSRELGDELKKQQEELGEIQARFDEQMLRMPNYPSPDCPVGPDESANVVLRKVGEPTKFDFTPRDHIELMELNDWSEMERIAKVSGSRTYAIKNDLAQLELAIHMMVLDKLRSHGFTVITVPSISKERPLYGQGYLPFSRDEIYYMPADDLYLSGTAELILNSLRADEILSENELPILYAGFLSSGVGYTLQIIGQKGLNPTMASLLMSLESVFSVLAGWIFLHQALSGRELSGCILMFAAIVLVQLPGFSKTSAVS